MFYLNRYTCHDLILETLCIHMAHHMTVNQFLKLILTPARHFSEKRYITNKKEKLCFGRAFFVWENKRSNGRGKQRSPALFMHAFSISAHIHAPKNGVPQSGITPFVFVLLFRCRLRLRSRRISFRNRLRYCFCNSFRVC